VERPALLVCDTQLPTRELFNLKIYLITISYHILVANLVIVFENVSVVFSMKSY